MVTCQHNHAPNPDQVRTQELVAGMKRRAVNHPEEPPARIIRDATFGQPEAVVVGLPQRETLRRQMNRARARSLPQNPKSLDELDVLPDEYRRTVGGMPFLVYDSYDDDQVPEDDEDEGNQDRILVFSTNDSLKHLASSGTIFIDGTFSVCPTLFTQLLTVHGEVRGTILPLVFALLPGKEEAMYVTVLEKLRRRCEEERIQWEPGTIVSDFELAIINASRHVFPRSQIRCCFFHLGQSVYRHVQHEGLQGRYQEENGEIRKATHMLLALAFVPLADQAEAFRLLEEEVPVDFLPIMRYFDRPYLRGRRARGRRAAVRPRFPPEWWNLHQAALHNDHRTNNATEGWHNRFNTLVGKRHPTFYLLLREIRKEEADTVAKLQQLNAGQQVKQPRKKIYERVNARLTSIVQEYPERRQDLTAFLRGIGHNIQV